MTKTIELRTGDKATRASMLSAHEAGRHGDGTQSDVLDYWAGICADCHWKRHYES